MSICVVKQKSADDRRMSDWCADVCSSDLVAIARRPGAYDLGEEGDADAHQLTGLTARKGGALFLLLGAQRGIAGRLDRLLHGGGVVAAVVLPAQRRLIRELVRLDEVLQAQLDRVQDRKSTRLNSSH